MPTFEFEKIVRDEIPELTRSQGGEVELDNLSPRKRYDLLVTEKIDEELDEIRKADTDDKKAEEIADAIDVLYGAAAQLGLDEEDIDRLREHKTARAGAFVTAPYVISVTVPEDNPWVKGFRDNPEKYPER